MDHVQTRSFCKELNTASGRIRYRTDLCTCTNLAMNRVGTNPESNITVEKGSLSTAFDVTAHSFVILLG